MSAAIFKARRPKKSRGSGVTATGRIGVQRQRTESNTDSEAAQGGSFQWGAHDTVR